MNSWLSCLSLERFFVLGDGDVVLLHRQQQSGVLARFQDARAVSEFVFLQLAFDRRIDW